MKKIVACYLILSGSISCCYAQRIMECTQIEKDSIGRIQYICKSSYRYDGDEKLISEHVITRMDTTKRGHKEKNRLIVHKKTTDSIVEHFYFYDKTGDYVRDKVHTYSFDNKTHRLISKTTEHADSINPIIYPKKLMTLYYYDNMGRIKKIVQGDLDSKRFHKKFKDKVSYENDTVIIKGYILYTDAQKRRPRKLLIPHWESNGMIKRVLNNKGLVIRKEDYNSDYETWIVEYQYDEYNNLIKEENYSLKNSIKQLMWSYEFIYKYEK